MLAAILGAYGLDWKCWSAFEVLEFLRLVALHASLVEIAQSLWP